MTSDSDPFHHVSLFFFSVTSKSRLQSVDEEKRSLLLYLEKVFAFSESYIKCFIKKSFDVCM